MTQYPNQVVFTPCIGWSYNNRYVKFDRDGVMTDLGIRAEIPPSERRAYAVAYFEIMKRHDTTTP